MKRYLSMMHGPTISAISENGNWKNPLASADEWVWQFSESEAQAIKDHEKKQDEWAIDSEKGIEKHTY